MSSAALLIVAVVILAVLVLRWRLIIRTQDLRNEVVKTRALIARTRALTAVIQQRRTTRD